MVAFLTIIGWIVFASLIKRSQSQFSSCFHYSDESLCIGTGRCEWENNRCECASQVQLDILVGIDASGSIGYDNFQLQKQFIQTVATQIIPDTARIGFTVFATAINESRAIQYWDTNDLEDYTAGIYWSQGWTSTHELLASASKQFTATKEQDRDQLLLMITDGNPCHAAINGACPMSACDKRAGMLINDVTAVIVGIGDGLNTIFVDCLVRDTADFITGSYTGLDSVNVMAPLSDILCPVTQNVIAVTATDKITVIASDGNYWYDDFAYTNTDDFNVGSWYNPSQLSADLGSITSTCDECAGTVWGWWSRFVDAGTGVQDPARQLTRQFYCASKSSVQFSASVYFCQMTVANKDEVYIRRSVYSENDFLHRVTFVENTGTNIGGSGTDKPGTSCNANIIKYDINDDFTVDANQLITITVTIDQHADGNDVIAFNNFRMKCNRIPTSAPTHDPTEMTYSPTNVTPQPTNVTPQPTNVTPQPTRVPTKIPSLMPIKYPTAAPTETRTQSPTETRTKSPTKMPTISATIDFEPCIRDFVLFGGLGSISIYIDRINQKYEMILSGPRDEWWGIGFGGSVMSNTFVITASDQVIDVKRRILANHKSGDIVVENNNEKFEIINEIDIGEDRIVSFIGDWYSGIEGVYDFTDFFECQNGIRKLPIIWAKGYDYNFGYHGKDNKGFGLYLYSCSCQDTDGPTNVPTEEPTETTTRNPTTRPTFSPTENVVNTSNAQTMHISFVFVTLFVFICVFVP